jgi:hypothetical protein
MDDLILRPDGGKSGCGIKPGAVHRRRRVEAKNEAPFPGRVPHVRPSVHGPKKIGRSPFQRYYNAGKKTRRRARILKHAVKAFEESVFSPCTLGRTWGTRPEPKTVVARSIPPALTTLCCYRSLGGLRHLGRTFAEHCGGPFGTRQTTESKRLQLLLDVIVDPPY